MLVLSTFLESKTVPKVVPFAGLILVQTSHKGLQRTANEYTEERRIYKHLISKNDK